MREIKVSRLTGKNLLRLLLRTFRLSALVLGIGLVVAGGVARAEDDDDERSFEERLMDNLMAGLGGTNMDNRGIEYRERSPLVVPPSLDLPPPARAAQAPAPNWPKDPDVQRRRAEIAARRKGKVSPEESARVLLPSELAAKRPKTSNADSDSSAPGSGAGTLLSPSQLGYNGGLMGIFGSGTRVETAPFKGEPTRDSLTQPPSGYQTPSPNFAYGTGPKQYLAPKIDPANGKAIE